MRRCASSSAALTVAWPERADWIAVAMVSPIAGHCGTRGRQLTSVSWSREASAASTKLCPPWRMNAVKSELRQTDERLTPERFAGPAKRSGVNRSSIWKDPDYVKLMNGFGDNFVEATMATLQGDTDVDWRPRVPQWPAIGDTMATAIQSALSGQATIKAALDDAQRRVEPMMRG